MNHFNKIYLKVSNKLKMTLHLSRRKRMAISRFVSYS